MAEVRKGRLHARRYTTFIATLTYPFDISGFTFYGEARDDSETLIQTFSFDLVDSTHINMIADRPDMDTIALGTYSVDVKYVDGDGYEIPSIAFDWVVEEGTTQTP